VKYISFVGDSNSGALELFPSIGTGKVQPRYTRGTRWTCFPTVDVIQAHDINALSNLGFVYDAKRLQENFAGQLDEQEKIEFAGLLAELSE
jgi:hypothetical protein